MHTRTHAHTQTYALGGSRVCEQRVVAREHGAVGLRLLGAQARGQQDLFADGARGVHGVALHPAHTRSTTHSKQQAQRVLASSGTQLTCMCPRARAHSRACGFPCSQVQTHTRISSVHGCRHAGSTSVHGCRHTYGFHLFTGADTHTGSICSRVHSYN